MAKWNSYPQLASDQLDGADLVPISDESEAETEKSKTASLDALRTFLGAGITVGVQQAGHGLSVGDVVRFDGTEYVKATADTAANSEAVGVVTVAETDAFAYQTAGVVSTLSGLTPGELYYLQDDGSLGASAGTVEKPILIATSATSAVLILAISGEGGGGGAADFIDLGDAPSSYTGHGGKVVAVTVGEDGLEFVTGGGGGNSYYDLQLGFPGAPDAGGVDLVLTPRAVTIDDADPGSVHVGTNPTDGTATIDVQINGVSVGDFSITTGGVVTWSLAADIVLAAGDRLSLVAPSPADSTLADVIVAFRGSAS